MTSNGDDIALVKTVTIPEFPGTYVVKQSRRRRKRCNPERDGNDLRCDRGDFLLETGRDSKGSEFLVCGKVNDAVCPKIGENNGTVMSVSIEGNDRNLTAFADCGYTRESITSDTAVTDYRNTFGSDDDFALILSANCFQTTEECPDDPLTGQKMPLCSKFVSTTNTGKVCREESLAPENSELVEADMQAYCRDNTTADCRCIDRTGTLIYDSLRTGTVTDDGCWWKWCAKPNEFLVPPNIVNATSETVCAPVRKEIAREINANLETIECCQIQQNVIYAPDGVTEQNVNCFFRDAQTAQSSWFSQYGWWIVLLIIFIAVVLVALFVIMVYHGHHRWGGYYSSSRVEF